MNKFEWDFEYVSKGTKFKLEVAKDLNVTKDTLDKEFMTQASKRAWYAVKYREAEVALDFLENDFEEWSAVMKNRVRGAATEKMTEKAVEEAIRAYPEYGKKRKLIIEQRHIVNVLKDVVSVFDQRSYMLMQLGKAKQFDENEFEPMIKRVQKRNIVYEEND